MRELVQLAASLIAVPPPRKTPWKYSHGRALAESIALCTWYSRRRIGGGKDRQRTWMVQSESEHSRSLRQLSGALSSPCASE